MPVPRSIAGAAFDFNLNTGLLTKCIEGLTAEEWVRQPNEHSNHMLWVVGHIVWARNAVLGMLGEPWECAWLGKFARGLKLEDAAEYPSPEELTKAHEAVAAKLTAAMEGATDEMLAAPAVARIPKADETLAGTITFLSNHDGYHVGQAAYLRSWMGRGGVAG